jgi:hypothetical protein
MTEVLPSKYSHALKLLVGVGAGVAMLFIVSIGFGTWGWDVSGTRLFGIFFAEWHFLTFFFYACLPLCGLAVALQLEGRRRSPRPQ